MKTQVARETTSTRKGAVKSASTIETTVGMGVTIVSHGDRHPGTIVEVGMGGKFKKVTVQQDAAKRIDKNGISDEQEYTYSRDKFGSVKHFRLRKGKWEEVHTNFRGRWRKLVGGHKIVFGEREKYWDPSF